MKDKTKHISRLIRQYVTEFEPSAEVILYGSRARGDENRDSDWDILILTDHDIGIERERKLRNKLYDLEIETGESFSVFVYSRNNWQNVQKVTPFYMNVTREGLHI
ncbi:MAG TPA: nucleotidyltransferase domain-containing protein [Bacteroidales bacterium]|nr:nucleotidyltransferase domain-containing protein [Bacteroidales bacterium]